jgi:hypothetical protein
MLAAKHVGARRGGVEELRGAIVRRWLDGGAAEAKEAAPAPAPAPAPVAEAAPARAPDEDLAAFARRVLGAARVAPTGRFGGNKVFIAHVHRQLGDPGLALAAFKERLVEAKRAGLVSLSRADLVEAMAPEDVRDSETSYLGAKFHFVRLEEEAPRW